MLSNPAKKVALYARVSCANGQSPEMQVAELREYAARRGWNVVGEYVDKGISGTKEKRPELDCLWSDCRKGKVDAVVVYRYDRFARSLRQLVNALEEFMALNVDFVSIHERGHEHAQWQINFRHFRQHR
jgi:DNA invertase Pin-like site-specific DNA recombinase